MSTTLRPTAPTGTSTPKPPPHRSTLVRKRDDKDEQIPSSPTKKTRVTFDSDVQVRMVHDWEKGPEIVHDEVRRALARRAVGDSSGYELIKRVYSANNTQEDKPTPRMIKHYTMALLNNVSALTKSNSDLVHQVLKSDWLGRQDDYVILFKQLMANIVSNHGTFLREAMQILVDNLAAAPSSNGKLPDQPMVSRSVIYNRTHEALQYVLQKVPSASRILSSVLINAFPHESDSRRAHTIYVQNLLRLATYVPELREEVLRLITERLVKIDVQVQLDLQDLAEEVGEGLVERIPHVRPDLMEDIDDTGSSEEESESDEDDEAADVHRTKDIIKNVEKMDSILDILFSYYDQVFTKGALENQISSLNTLLSHFITVILPTHRSRHTQFLLFHFAQKSPTHIDAFVGACAQITFDKNQSAIIRQAAAAYLASFVARGMHVESQTVRDVFDYLTNELERLRRAHELSCQGPNLARFSSFYVLVQAMLYIFCFRWRDLKYCEDDDFEEDGLDPYVHEHRFKSGVKEALSSNVFSKLNPLKVCSPAIVSEFARLSNHLGVIYLYHLIEINKRVHLQQYAGNAHGQPRRETALSARRDEENMHLDEYFPFDPYHLPKSKRWIEGDYREWAGIPGLDDVEEESESDSEDEESEVEEGTETDGTGKSV